MAKSGLAVLESRWWKNSNTSVRGVFDLIIDLNFDSHHDYDYEMVNSKAAFTESFQRYALDKKTNFISIASHGCREGIQLYNNDIVSRSIIRNILKRDTNIRCLSGLHLGSCFFGAKNLARFLFEEDISPWWVAGYSKRIDFARSTALDFIFFNEILEGDADDPVKTIKKVSKFLRAKAGGLCDSLQFGIYMQDGSSQVVNLLES